MKYRHHVITCLALAAPLLAGDDTPSSMIRQRMERNPAWQRAQLDPPFSLQAPAGFVTDEKVRAHQRTAAETLTARMRAAYDAGAKSFVVAPGEYRFSNNRGLVLDGWRDFSIDARGACFWFERPAEQLAANPQGLSLHHCRDIRIRGLSIDFDPPVYLQARLQELAPDGSRMLARIDPAWPQAPVPPGQFSIYTAAGDYVPQSLFRHEGATLESDGILRIAVDPGSLADNLNPKLLAYTRGRGRIEPGSLIALNFRRGHSIGLFDCAKVALEEVSVYQSPGMGILESEGAGEHVYRGVRLVRRPGTRRVHYGTADHLHSNRMLNGPQVIGCEFAHSSDDNINIHGNWAYVWRQLDPTTIVLGAPDAPPTGNRLTVYERVELNVTAEARILSVEPLQDVALLAEIKRAQVPQQRVAHRDRIVLVKLDRPVTVAAHQLADAHLNYASGFRVEDCYFHDSRSRGMLLSGACNGSVSNNIWRDVLDGISIYEESWGYAEGPVPANLSIRGNLIMDCGGVVPGGGITVGLVPGGRQGLRKVSPIRGLHITDNLLVNSGILTILYTDGGSVRDNILVEPLHYARFTDNYLPTADLYGQHGYFPRPRRAPISVWSSRDIEVSGNRIHWSGPATAQAPVDVGDFTTNIRVDANRLIELPQFPGPFEIEPTAP